MSTVKTQKKYGALKYSPPLLSRFEAENGQRQILENLPAAVYKCDPDGHITFYNKAAIALWGREPDSTDLWCGSWKIYEMDGQTLVPREACPMAVAIREGHSVRGKIVIVESPDGVRRIVAPHIDPVVDLSGNVVEAVNMLVDITDSKEKEIALLESEDKYRKLAGELQAALKTEEEFISIASHELKTPITSLNLYLEVLLQLHANSESGDTNYLLRRSKVQLDRLIALVSELLDVTKIKSGKLDLAFEEVCLDDVVNDVINDYASTISSHKIIKKGNSHSVLKLDKSRIEQVLTNLLTNAVKYSAKADTVVVTITEAEKEVKVDVQDFGIGIKSNDINKVFNRFFRAHGANSTMLSSLGLGLYISADIIKRHYGRIWVESEPGNGSVFHFTLPKTSL